MKERQALLEQLDIDQEKKEVAEERQKSMIFTLKEEVEKRAPSARVKALKERSSRMLEEEKKIQYQSMAKQMSPKWVGQWIPLKTGFRYSDESALKAEDWRRKSTRCKTLGVTEKDKMVKEKDISCSVPRGILEFGEIEEQHRTHRIKDH